MKRRFGPALARRFADLHEIINDIRRSQTERDRQMDDLNKALAADAPDFQTWEDVVRWARGKLIEAAPHDGDGEDGRAFWYRKQPPEWRPDFKDVPITPIEKGGPEHRYEADSDGTPQEEAVRRPSRNGDPLDRPVASWTEEDVRTVLGSPAYLRPQHPKHIETQARVRAWFEARFPGPVQVDATGRQKSDGNGAIASSQCDIPVRAHARNADKVQVAAHCRARPAA
jgi:hypothetical protein